MSMADKMKEKAIPATLAKCSTKIVKVVNKADVIALSRTMEPIIEQNARERAESWEYLHDKYVGTK